jgi:ESF2/ABP1 family protein
MATRKRNEWLDADESDEEEQNYESEDEGRAQTLRSKRQKVNHESDSEDAQDEPADEDEESLDDDEQEEADIEGDKSTEAELIRLEKLRATLKPDLKFTSGKLSKPLPPPSAPKKDKSGVIYLSRVPPFMKPEVLRSLLTPYGPIGRIFLTPETTTQRHQRLKSGGTRRKLYSDGWVEFMSKKDAKFVADNLNAHTIGGKKGNRWRDEVWNIKYLSGVKWSYLVEEIQNQNAERAVRLRKEIAKDKVENQRFLDNLEKGKMISGIEAKRKMQGKEKVEEKEQTEGDVAKKPAKRERKSKFEQHGVKTKFDKKGEPGEQLQSVLGGIF